VTLPTSERDPECEFDEIQPIKAMLLVNAMTVSVFGMAKVFQLI
jgi:hypothetical protein